MDATAPYTVPAAAPALPVETPWSDYVIGCALTEIVSSLCAPGSAVLQLAAAAAPALPGPVAGTCDLVTVRAEPPTADAATVPLLPFATGEFGCVLVPDVLDAWPANARPALLAEAARVSADLLVVAGPFDSPVVRSAGDAAQEMHRATHGAPHPTVAMHRELGLPDTDATRELLLELTGCEPMPLPVGSLRTWTLFEMMRAAAADLEMGDELVRNLTAYFNARFTRWDNTAPTHRTALVAGRGRSPERSARLAALRARFVAAPREAEVRALTDAIRLMADTYGAEARGKCGPSQAETAAARIRDLEARVRQQERFIAKLKDEVAFLQNSRDSGKQEGILKRFFTP